MTVGLVLHVSEAPTDRPVSPLRQRIHRFEDGVTAVLMGAMVAVPLIECAARTLLGSGLQGASALIQNLTLVVSLLGAALATREGKLLAFATAGYLPVRARALVHGVTSMLASTITAMLGVSAVLLVMAERAGGTTLAYQVPTWVVQLVLPVSFGLILWRLIRGSAAHTAPRALVGVAGLLLAAAWLLSPVSPQAILLPGLLAVTFATMLGLPMFASLGGISLLLLGSNGVPLASLALDHYTLASNATLPAIPLFTLAGFLLAESRAPTRLIGVFDAAFGGLRSGGAIACALVCTVFTSFTGASGISILALGGLMLPILRRAHYSDKAALGLITAAGLPGTMLVPALPLILYAIVAKVPFDRMFVGGVLPTLLMLSLVILWVTRRGAVGARRAESPAARPRLRDALWTARWDLGLPLVPLIALGTGVASPVEAAAATAGYALLLTTVLNRDLDVRRDLPRAMARCGLLIGGILLVLGVALALTNYVVDAQLPERVVAWVSSLITSRWAFLLALNLFLLLVGCMMDIYSAIIVIAPLIVPLGVAYDVHPVHLGIVFLANMELGYLTPPVGLNLFYASTRFGRPILEICRATLPYFLLFALGVLVITYVPMLSTVLL